MADKETPKKPESPKDPNEVPIKVKPPIKGTPADNSKKKSPPRDAKGHFIKGDGNPKTGKKRESRKTDGDKPKKRKWNFFALGEDPDHPFWANFCLSIENTNSPDAEQDGQEGNENGSPDSSFYTYTTSTTTSTIKDFSDDPAIDFLSTVSDTDPTAIVIGKRRYYAERIVDGCKSRLYKCLSDLHKSLNTITDLISLCKHARLYRILAFIGWSVAILGIGLTVALAIERDKMAKNLRDAQSRIVNLELQIQTQNATLPAINAAPGTGVSLTEAKR